METMEPETLCAGVCEMTPGGQGVGGLWAREGRRRKRAIKPMAERVDDDVASSEKTAMHKLTNHQVVI